MCLFLRLAQLGFLAGLQIACPQALPNHAPNAAMRLYYPGSMAATADGATVYIVNSNFDHRYSAGWITSIQVDTLLQAIDAKSDLTGAFNRSLMVPSLGGRLLLSPDETQAFLPQRGQGLLTIMKINQPTSTQPLPQISCSGSSGREGLNDELSRTDCDRAHLVYLVPTAVDPADKSSYRSYYDPYVVAWLNADNTSSAPVYLVVGYLHARKISVFAYDPALPTDLTLQQDIYLGQSAVDNLQPHPTRAGILTGIGRHVSPDKYIPGSTTASFVYDIDVLNSIDTQQDKVSIVDVGLDVGGRDLGGIAYSPDAKHLYVTNRHPDSLVALKSLLLPVNTLNPLGQLNIDTVPQLQVVDATALNEAGLQRVVYVARQSGDLLITTGFLNDSLYLFSPVGDSVRFDTQIKLATGSGPYDVVYVQRQGRELLLVSTFLNHGLSVFDISNIGFADVTETKNFVETVF